MIAFFDILYYVISGVNAYFVYKIISTFLPVRSHIVMRLMALLLCYWIANIVIYLNDIENYTLMFSFFIFYITVFYKGSFTVKLSVVFIFYPLIAAVNFLNKDIGYQIFLMLPERVDELYSSITHTALLLPVTLIWFIVWQFGLKRFISISELLDMKMWLMLDTVYVVLLVGLFVSLNFLTDPFHAYPLAF
ncbi:MAG: hypothetical protein LBV08_00395, partial [Clostridiales bacterium]|nr:hypothetical protein [Clostridiales bacterium]